MRATAEILENSPPPQGRAASKTAPCRTIQHGTGIADTFDRVLTGMVGAGLVKDAICAYLTLTVDLLSSHLVRLDLPAPPDRPLRKPSGKTPWTEADIQVLVRLWGACVHPDIIRLHVSGDRSANAIRAKARRLGLFRRARGSLTRNIPQTPEISVVSGGSGGSWREIGNNAKKRIRWTAELDLEIARRWLAWQDRHSIARDLGLTEGQVRTRATRMGLPSRRNDSDKCVADYIEGRAYDRKLHALGSLQWCKLGNMWYFAYRNGPRTCPKIMKTKAYRESRSGAGVAFLHI